MITSGVLTPHPTQGIELEGLTGEENSAKNETVENQAAVLVFNQTHFELNAILVDQARQVIVWTAVPGSAVLFQESNHHFLAAGGQLKLTVHLLRLAA